MLGKDGEVHAITVQASSLFDAAQSGIQEWARLWWFSPDALIVVRSGDEVWRVKQETLQQQRDKRFRDPTSVS